MKTKMKTLGFAAIICAAFLQSCTKDAQSDSTSASSVEELMEQISPEMQTFTIDPTKDNTITGKDGTKILIPANALVDANGNAVSGSVTISLQEILSLKDQFTSGISASSNGKILASGGEFFFEATLNGQKLNVALNSEITVTIPAEKVDTSMQVFLGQNVSVAQQNDSVKGSVNWVPNSNSLSAQDSSANYEKYFELINGVSEYTMKINNLYYTSYYNIDHYLQSYSNSKYGFQCKLKADDNHGHEEIRYIVKLVYKNFGYVGDTYAYESLVHEGSVTVNNYLMFGEQVDLVVVGIGSTSKNIYYGKVHFTASANSQPNISLKTITKTELEKELDNL